MVTRNKESCHIVHGAWTLFAVRFSPGLGYKTESLKLCHLLKFISVLNDLWPAVYSVWSFSTC